MTPLTRTCSIIASNSGNASADDFSASSVASFAPSSARSGSSNSLASISAPPPIARITRSYCSRARSVDVVTPNTPVFASRASSRVAASDLVATVSTYASAKSAYALRTPVVLSRAFATSRASSSSTPNGVAASNAAASRSPPRAVSSATTSARVVVRALDASARTFTAPSRDASPTLVSTRARVASRAFASALAPAR